MLTLLMSFEFCKWSKSAISCVAGWINFWMSSEKGELFMARWSIPSCTHGQVHSMDYDWLLVYAWAYKYIYIYILAFILVVLQGLYWVTACFIFVSQLDASWEPLSYCYYSTMSSFLLLKQYLAYLAHLTAMVCEIGGE